MAMAAAWRIDRLLNNSAIIVVFAVGTLCVADDKLAPSKVGQNPREVVEEFLEVVARGETIDAAQWFTTGDARVARWTKRIRQIVPNAKVPIATVHAVDSRAFVVTKLLNGRLVKGNPGVFTIILQKSPHLGWLIHDITYVTEESASSKRDQFLKEYPTAKPVPAATEK